MHLAVQAFVINLDRSPERMANMERRLNCQPIQWHRVPAIDGHRLELSSVEDVDAAGYRWRHGKSLNPAEVGCYLSHLRALDQFLRGDAEYGLLLEDDAAFPADFPSLLTRLIQVDHLWDVVKLSGFHSGTPIHVEQLVGPYALAVPLSRHMNANCILYSRRAARILSQRLRPMALPFDHALERAWLCGLKPRIVTPTPCPADTGMTSTIGDRTHLKRFKFPILRRVPAMLFRLQTEILRFVFGLRQVAGAFGVSAMYLRRGAGRPFRSPSLEHPAPRSGGQGRPSGQR